MLFVQLTLFFDELDENMLRRATTNSAGWYTSTEEFCTDIRPLDFSPSLKMSAHILTYTQYESC